MKIKRKLRVQERSHLETLRGLTQFERCWATIETGIYLYDEIDRLKSELQELRERVKVAIKLIHDSNEYYGGMNILADVVGWKMFDPKKLNTIDLKDFIVQNTDLTKR